MAACYIGQFKAVVIMDLNVILDKRFDRQFVIRVVCNLAEGDCVVFLHGKIPFAPFCQEVFFLLYA